MRNMVLAAVVCAAAAWGVSAATPWPIPVKITVANLAPAGSTALSPFFLAAHDGTFTMFTSGAAASAGVQQVAESGAHDMLQTAFMTAHPSGVVGSAAASFGPGIFQPGVPAAGGRPGGAGVWPRGSTGTPCPHSAALPIEARRRRGAVARCRSPARRRRDARRPGV